MAIKEPSKSLLSLIESLVTEEIGEMAIQSFKTVGNWDRRSSFSNDVDRRLLTSPKAVEKIKKQWEKTPYDFDIYLVNDRRVNRPEFREAGVRSLEFLRNNMKISPEEIPDPTPGRITVVFTNNRGDARYMATGWILAHRLGHAFNVSRNDPLGKEWQEFTQRLRDLFAEILDQVYDIKISKVNFGIGSAEKLLKYVAQQMGTMKSARDQKMRTWYEFAYELFAQYLITGKIKFNPLPDQLVTNIRNYGHKDIRGVRWPASQKMYNNHDLEYYADELESMLSNVLDRAVGKILVM